MRVFVIVIIAASCSWADPTLDRTTQIQEWIGQLSHDRYRVRDAATMKLKEAGAAACKPLVKVARSGDIEASNRAMQILADLAESTDPKTEEAARSALRQLAEIDARIANEAQSILARRRHHDLARLKNLGVSYRVVGHGEIREAYLDDVDALEAALVLLKEFPEIESLSLSNKRFTGKMAAHLVPLRNINSLNLFESGFDDSGVKYIKELPNLRHLPMGYTKITDEGLKTIGTMKQLTYLGLRGNNVTDAGVAHLKELGDLRGLYLGETKVADDGLKQVAQLTKLNTLYLHSTVITDRGLEHLFDLKELSRITLGKTKVTPEGRQRLKDNLRDIAIDEEP